MTWPIWFSVTLYSIALLFLICKRARLKTLIIWSLFWIPLNVGVYNWSHQRHENNNILKLKELRSNLSKVRSNLEQSINSDTALIRGLAAYISLHPNIEQVEFSDFSALLMKNKTQIINLGAAPDGIISFIHPFEENQQAIGLNLFRHRDQKEAAIKTQHNNEIIMAGPVDLVQGGKAIIGRLTVRTQHSFSKSLKSNEQQNFWGLVSAPISLHALLINSGYEALSKTVDLALRGKDAKGAEGDIIKGDIHLFDDPNIQLESIELPKGSWKLAGKLKSGHQAYQEWWLWILPWTTGLLLLAFLIMLEKNFQDALLHQKKLLMAKDAAEAGAKAKTQFLASMSHEIRTPMNGVIGLTDLLLEEELEDHVRSMVKTIHSSGQALLVIINDILDLSKINAGKLSLEQISFNVIEAIEDVLKVFEPLSKEKRLILKFEYHPERFPQKFSGMVCADIFRLKQVLNNLLSNAIKFTEHGSVVVHLQPKGKDELSISVEDSGIGLTPKQQQKLFTDFSQADQSTTRKFGGTGLGLAICKKIVEAMGGSISVRSIIGKGSKFTFSLPMNLDLVQHKTAPISSEEVSKQKIDLKGTSILLAEDNEINIKVISKMLTRFNADFTVTKNGKEAVEAFKAQPVDLILMDLQMPEIDGYEASQHILEHSDQQPYIIALTANSTQEDRNKCSQVGMKGFVSKPVTLSSLKDGLSDFLKHQNSASRN